jgi:hypothetical protein
MSSTVAVTADMVLEELRQLPPRERLRVIAQALPEVERELQEPASRPPSLRGLWKGLDFDISAEEIDEARREAWSDFPRGDI